MAAIYNGNESGGPGGSARLPWGWLRDIASDMAGMAEFFEKTFYPAYPRQEAPHEAWNMFRRLRREWSPELAAAILESLDVHCRCDQWRNPIMIPQARTWLGQRRWEGVPPIALPPLSSSPPRYRSPDPVIADLIGTRPGGMRAPSEFESLLDRFDKPELAVELGAVRGGAAR